MNYTELIECQNDIIKLVENYNIIDIKPTKKYHETFKKIPVWVMWDQGFENAPDLVKVCINSIKEHIPQDIAELILITNKNLDKYLELPDYILSKLYKKPTAFSNIIRAALLYNYGGMWIDSTYIIMNDFPKEIFQKDFWALKKNYHYLNNKNFIDFSYNFMYSKPENEMIGFIYSMLCNYWKNYNYQKHYFLKDGIILYGYNFNKFDIKLIDDLEDIYNEDIEFFNNNELNKPYLKEKFKENNFSFFKLTYKLVELKEYNNNQLTYWGYFKQKYLTKGELKNG